jgi:hypothetical protein
MLYLSSLLRQNFTSLGLTICIIVIWGSVPPREHLEHEQDSSKLNVWCVLAQEKVIGPFYFDVELITRNSLLDILENDTLLQLSITAFLFFNWTVHLFGLFTLSMTVSQVNK